MRIAVVAASSRFDGRGAVEAALAPVLADFPGVSLDWRLVEDNESIHFAGRDEDRLALLVEAANDPEVDAIWFARGGYGSNRIALEALESIDHDIAKAKKWIGYSDVGFLLAGLYASGHAQLAHGPMPKDAVAYGNGAEAVRRSLAWLTENAGDALEPHLEPGGRHAAFNITVLSMLLGTPLEPDLSGHVLMLEETDEHLYATDRALFHITAHLADKGLAGIRLGRIAPKREDGHVQAFDETPKESARRWCERFGIPFLGRAEIGHDSANRVVPFGLHPAL
jgi:muramoyltetrapeptide carboxypeptidase